MSLELFIFTLQRHSLKCPLFVCVCLLYLQKECPAEWTSLSNSCYLLYNDTMVNWTTAREFCFSKGGDLAVITSQLEFDTVIGYFNESAPRATWLGGVYNETLSTWHWINEEPWVFDLFDVGYVYEPGHCLTLRNINMSYKREWKGSPPDDNRYVLCERDN